ncbi:MAG: SGNH/GDSL hydrolase family protein, partial [Victivallales bacterium]|nr:SGNH/GDSL hydrolase family protein [Victivallales bacterium]
MNRNLRLTMALIALSALPVRRPVMGAEQGRGEWDRRSLLSQGNVARIQHAMAKARRGEPVTIAVIGGSITQGARASKPQNRYGNLVAQWWRQNFPKSRIQFVNAGIGGTGSNYGC